MADEDTTVTITLLGRQMQVRQMTPGQTIIMMRLANRAQKQSDASKNPAATVHAYKDLMIKMMDLVDTLFVSESDRQDVEDALIARQLDINDLMNVALGGRRAPEPDDDADVVPKALKNKKPAGVAKVTKKAASKRARA